MPKSDVWTSRAKVVGAVLLVVLALVVAFQNTESVDTQVLFMTVAMPRVLLLLLAGLTGFVAGVLVSLALSKRMGKST